MKNKEISNIMKTNSIYVEILSVIVDTLSNYQIDTDLDLGTNKAISTTIGSLGLDSLDMLQFALDVEDALDLEIDIVEFPDDATLDEVAKHIEQLHSEQKNRI